ncbi:hypothetical protein HMPREF3221_01756 [Fusobacterium nucleatum]|uniref:Uncharacterized protein n=1 Tax=Fusobacterium nucleatum TaxID=851 RepID=A0A133NQZ4_FUSNU|nr:hypothetical protein HMPREF3221_01756 [Fusobacterium nucleatum]
MIKQIKNIEFLFILSFLIHKLQNLFKNILYYPIINFFFIYIF